MSCRAFGSFALNPAELGIAQLKGEKRLMMNVSNPGMVGLAVAARFWLGGGFIVGTCMISGPPQFEVMRMITPSADRAVRRSLGSRAKCSIALMTFSNVF